MATKNDTEYANAHELANTTTNHENLPPSHKATLSSSDMRINFSCLLLKPDHIFCPCWTCLRILASEKLLHVLKEKLELWMSCCWRKQVKVKCYALTLAALK
eukprot:15348245-Ditylum_brightwellii.AAC.1